ncbi:hypothetical protein WJX79_009133 [Trebouxia sp. C0005]
MARSRSASRSRHLEDHGRKRRRASPTPSPARTRRHDSRDSPRRVDRYRHRSEDERDRLRHRDQADDRRAGPRNDSSSHRETERLRDRLGSRDPDSKASDRVERKPNDTSNVAAAAEDAAATEAPKERTVLKAGPAGGAYIPPFRLAQMMREANDKSGPQFQRMTWDALRKSLNGLINKVNVQNIKEILPDIFRENLIRGRGVFCRSLMKSQLASPTFTPTYAALIAIVNTKFPEIGELLLKRVISQFLKAFKRNDKGMAVGCLKFIAHLCNQQVAHEALALEIMVLLLETPTNDSVEIALEFARDVAALLEDTSPQSFTMVQSGLRTILQEGTLLPRTQMLIQNFFSAVSYGVMDPDSAKEKARLKTQEDNRKLGFPDRPVHGLPPRIPIGLDLVDAADARCHNYDLDSPLDRETGLDIFKVDPEYETHEAEYQAIKDEILGVGGSEDEEDDDGEEGDEGASESEDEEQEQQKMQIQDQTQTDLINLRRTIYLTIMSSAQFEEAGHKLMKIKLAQGQEIEVVTMLIECCSQEKTYISYYGHLSQRFCNISCTYQELFEQCFSKQYALIHRLETNKLRNVARLFAHLLTTDALSWSVLSCIRLTEEDTTSSSRIFIKILFQDLSENLGLMSLNQRLQEPTLQMFFAGIFPKDTPRNMRFSINFFTSIGLGPVTDGMREHLKNLPRLIATQQPAASDSDSDSSSDDSSSDSSSGSDSDSDSSDSSNSDSSSSDSDSSSSSDSEDEAPPKRSKGKAPLPPPPVRPASNGAHRRSSLREDVEPRVQDLSIDKRAQEPRHSSRNGHYPSNYVTDGHEDPYEDPQRARQSHRGRREGRDGYDEGAGSKHRRGSRGDEPAQYGARDTDYRDSRTDRRSREEEDDRRDDGSRSRKDRHAAREEEEGYDDRGRGHRDKDGYEEGREYARREHRSSRRDRSHRDDDRGHDRRGPIPDDDRWDGRN